MVGGRNGQDCRSPPGPAPAWFCSRQGYPEALHQASFHAGRSRLWAGNRGRGHGLPSQLVHRHTWSPNVPGMFPHCSRAKLDLSMTLAHPSQMVMLTSTPGTTSRPRQGSNKNQNSMGTQPPDLPHLKARQI